MASRPPLYPLRGRRNCRYREPRWRNQHTLAQPQRESSQFWTSHAEVSLRHEETYLLFWVRERPRGTYLLFWAECALMSRQSRGAAMPNFRYWHAQLKTASIAFWSAVTSANTLPAEQRPPHFRRAWRAKPRFWTQNCPYLTRRRHDQGGRQNRPVSTATTINQYEGA